jgi:HD-like signal output (HDOD) protein
MPDLNGPVKDQLLAALAKLEQLAPAPRTLGRVIQLLRQPDSGVHAIAELIRCDSGLAADVLRCANSAYYNRSIRVAAINDAVQVIGFQETVRIVSLVAVRQTTHRDLDCYGIPAEDFWSESLFNGLFAEALARRVGSIDAGEAYTVGLLRFIGRLAINQVIEDLGFGLFWDRTIPVSVWERASTGHTQAAIGARLLRKWDFPEHMALAMEAQEQTEAVPPDTAHPLVAALNFAAQVLPAGTGLAELPTIVGTPHLFAAAVPFAAAHQLTAEATTELLEEAYRSFVEIRETLYR